MSHLKRNNSNLNHRLMKERQLDISICEGKNLFRPLKPIRIGTSDFNPAKSAFRTVSAQRVRDLKPKHFSGEKDLKDNVENHGISATSYTNYNDASLDTNKAIEVDNFNNSYNNADVAKVSDLLSGTDLTIAKDQCNIANTGVARLGHCFIDKGLIGVIEDCVVLDTVSDSDKHLVQPTTRKNDVDLERFSHARDKGEPRLKKTCFGYAKTRAQITAQLISAFVFAT